MGQKYHVPCEDVDISHGLMERGHGGLTTGSECAGGIIDVRVRYCVMLDTDRGLRVKNRRGRGENAVTDKILFDHVDMKRVGAPFVVNCLYYCDPDGHSDYVQSREPLPVDHRTPSTGELVFSHIDAQDCGACAGYFLGLPESPIRSIRLEDCRFTYDPNAKPFLPAMADGVEICQGQGLIVYYADQITLRNVSITGQQGEKLVAVQVGNVLWEGEQ
jgi:polygalacturonase